MVTIKTINYAGGACPYQIEATTDDGKFFYLRYRWGTLRYGVWENEAAFDCKYTFSKVIGDEYAGWGDNKLIAKALEGHVVFPEGFMHESFSEKNYPQDGVFDGIPITEADVQAVKKLLNEQPDEDSSGPRNPIIPD